MIPKVDRVPEAGRANWRKHTVKESSIPTQVPVGATFTTFMEMADNATVEGTPVNRASEIELLSASGTTTGTSSAMLLAQPNFTLFDGAPIRFKVHVAPAESFTLNVAGTGVKQVVGSTNESVGSGLVAGTWMSAIYSQTLDKWIVSAGGGTNMSSIEQGQPNFYEKDVTTATLSADMKSTAVLGSGWSGTMPTFTRTVSGSGVLSFPVSIVSGRTYEIAFGSFTGDSSLRFNIILASSAAATSGQIVASGIYIGNTNVQAVASGNYSHINLVTVVTGAATLTIASIRYFTSLNSHSFSAKNLPVIIKDKNLAIGNGGRHITTGDSSIAIGSGALELNSSGTANTAIGVDALKMNVSGARNVAIGATTLQSNIGGGLNCAIGDTALKSNIDGASNVAIGGSALTANVGGSMSVAVGNYTLSKHASSTFNVAIGYSAFQELAIGASNVAIGVMSAMNATDASNSVFIGQGSNPLSATSASNEIVIGAGATGGGGNTFTLGNSFITKLRCQVTAITALSDKRVKEEIQPADTGMCLDAVKNLPIHRYKYKDFTGTHVDKHVTGFLADDVEKVFPKAVSTADQHFPVLDENGQPIYEEITDDQGNVRMVEKRFLITDVKDITMTEAIPTMWGAIQALLERIEALEGK